MAKRGFKWNHSERGRAYEKQWKRANAERINADRRAKRKSWSDAGLCRNCGHEKEAAFAVCAKCRSQNRAAVAKKHEHHKAKKRAFYWNNRDAALAASKAWRMANQEKVKEANRRHGKLSYPKRREYMMRQAYGITMAEWRAMLASQGDRCALCETDKPGGRGWMTDHDHKTGLLRAILCHMCNLGLGTFRDDPTLLRRAADYVEKHARKPRAAA